MASSNITSFFSTFASSMTASSIGSHLISFLTGNFYLSSEMQSFWMAIQGCMIVRSTRNPTKTELQWFHAFCLSVLAGYAGGWFGFILMAKPTSMFYNDLNMASCILAFVLVNCTPLDVGYKLLQTLPLALITVSFAQLFRSIAIPKFVDVCYHEFATKGTPYYPSIPVFGPIMYATLLGNMGGFITKGIEGHVSAGMPWAIQNGLFTAGFYHFFVNDKTGFVGIYLRQLVAPLVAALQFDINSDADRATFAICFVSLFMQVMGVLQMPHFLGPNCTPFVNPWNYLTRLSLSSSSLTKAPTKIATAAAAATNGTGPTAAPAVNASNKKRRNKNKNMNKVE